MPLYEYKCHSCGDQFEVIQKFSDEPLKVHEKCGGEVERLISPSALQFKGSGWYVTDYGKGNSKDAKPKTSTNGGEKSGSTESSGKTESSSSTSTSTNTTSTTSDTKSK